MRDKAIAIMQKLEAAGFKSYIVGGAVRDMLLGIPVKDYDIATEAPVADIVTVLGAKAVPSRSGAPVTIVDDIEVASFRKEAGTRHEVKFEPGTLEDDAHRRDFTINALYLSLDGVILDPTGGRMDLEDKEIIFVGEPSQRIKEDPTRVLRAYRLAAQKGFTIHGGERTAIKQSAHLLADIAEEQKGRELLKLLSVPDGNAVVEQLKAMLEDGVLQYLLPEVAALAGVEQNQHHLEGDVFEHTMRVLAHTEPDPVLRFAALLHDIGKKPTQKLKEAK